jgi:hypothetical protein
MFGRIYDRFGATNIAEVQFVALRMAILSLRTNKYVLR